LEKQGRSRDLFAIIGWSEVGQQGEVEAARGMLSDEGAGPATRYRLAESNT